jgi:flagellar motor switch protein FliN/FliY
METTSVKKDTLSELPVRITVELGSTVIPLNIVKELGEGSIIELSKLAGEPVNIKANGLLIAFGEVVVVDDNFGVRVTERLSPEERTKYYSEHGDLIPYTTLVKKS